MVFICKVVLFWCNCLFNNKICLFFNFLFKKYKKLVVVFGICIVYGMEWIYWLIFIVDFEERVGIFKGYKR